MPHRLIYLITNLATQVALKTKAREIPNAFKGKISNTNSLSFFRNTSRITYKIEKCVFLI